MAYPSRGIAYSVTGVSTFRNTHAEPQERDLSADLVPLLAALRRFGEDGDAAVALVAPLGDEVRAKLAATMVRRHALFGAPVIRAVLAATPKVALGRVMGAVAAAHAWKCYVMEASNV